MRQDEDQLLESLYQAYFNKLVLFATASVHNASVAQEIAQDTFHEAVLHIDQLMKHPNHGGWLIQTAKYKILEYQRQRSLDLHRTVPLFSEELRDIADDSPSLHNAEAASEADLMQTIQVALTTEEFRLFRRLILDQASHLTVAKEFGISISASQKRLERIRTKLKKVLT